MKKSCSIEGCEKPRYYAKDWCTMHFRRWQRNGDPLARQVYRGDPVGSLAAHSKKVGDCLVWTGAPSKDGYGIMKVAGRTTQVHLVSWELAHGPVPEGMQVDHTCHTRACFKVEHLRLATHSENQWNRSGSMSATGHRNVYNARGGGYYVQIRRGGKKISFGSYSNLSDAAEAARRGRRELFGDFAGKG